GTNTHAHTADEPSSPDAIRTAGRPDNNSRSPSNNQERARGPHTRKPELGAEHRPPRGAGRNTGTLRRNRSLHRIGLPRTWSCRPGKAGAAIWSSYASSGRVDCKSIARAKYLKVGGL